MATIEASVATVRALMLARIIATVPAGTPVYDYTRHVTDEATINSLLKDTGGALHFWFFSLSAETPCEVLRLITGDSRLRLRWSLHGYMALDDSAATEKTFDAEAARVADAFEADKKLLTAGAPNTIDSGPAQREAGGHVMIVSRLCHYARMSFLTISSLE